MSQSFSPDENRFSADEPSKKTGMSTGGKVAIGVGIGCGLLMLLICGGFIGFGFYVQNMIANAMSEDPAVVRSNTSAITEIEVPAGFQPKMTMDVPIPFQGERFFLMVMYENENSSVGQDTLVLMQFGAAMQQDERSMKQQFEQALENNDQELEEISEETREEVEYEIRGEKAQFTIIRGTGKQSESERWLVQGVFPGKEGLTWLFFQASTEDVSREQIDELLQSIK